MNLCKSGLQDVSQNRHCEDYNILLWKEILLYVSDVA